MKNNEYMTAKNERETQVIKLIELTGFKRVQLRAEYSDIYCFRLGDESGKNEIFVNTWHKATMYGGAKYGKNITNFECMTKGLQSYTSNGFGSTFTHDRLSALYVALGIATTHSNENK